MTPENINEPKAETQGSSSRLKFLKKNILFFFALSAFVVLFLIKILNPYSSPSTALQTLIRGIQATDEAVLNDEHFLFSNELTYRYGEEVIDTWKKIDREGKIYYDRARAMIRNKGREEFGKLDRAEKEDIEAWSYRRYINSIAYPLIKNKDPKFPDSLIFCDAKAKNEFVHREGMKTLKREEQAIVGIKTRQEFITKRDSFFIYETQRSNARKAKSRYQEMLNLYNRIDRTGMAVYMNYFEKLEAEAAESLNRLTKQELANIRSHSLNEYLITTGYAAALNEIREGSPDRYDLTQYSDSIFLDENHAMRYRFEKGLKNAGSTYAEVLAPFDYRMGHEIRQNPHVFIHEAGRIRVFDFIRRQIARETFTLTTVLYRSYETSLFHTPVAEVETNIGAFVFHQRGGEWYLADYH